MQKLKFLSLLFSFPFLAHAQFKNKGLENNIKIDKEKKHKVMLSVVNNNFIKNYEYFGNIATGYTLFGSQLFTQLAYEPNEHLRIQGGLYIRKDFGTQDLKVVTPILSIKLQKNGYQFIMGNLEGNYAHRLIDPIYSYERAISFPLENGIQFKIKKRNLFSDTWINWEQQEYQASPFKEWITAGNSSLVNLYKSKSGFKVELPIQVLFHHHGGQIDADTLPMLTVMNAATGLVLSYKPQHKNSFIKEVKTEDYYTIYKDVSPNKQQAFNKGNGVFLNASVMSKFGAGVSLGYWQGDGYIAKRGGSLYQSVSSVYNTVTNTLSDYTEKSRKLFFVRFMYQKKIMKDLYADVRLEPYYDINDYSKLGLEYCYSINLVYKKDFNLFNIKETKKEDKHLIKE